MPHFSPQSLCLLIICISMVVLAVLRAKDNGKNKEPSLDDRLKDVEARLAINSDDSALHLLHAELLLRKNAPHTALQSLEKAFIAGMQRMELEPTFWACYDSITSYRHRDDSNQWKPGPKIWRQLCDEAPTLVKQLGNNISICEASHYARANDAAQAADKKFRQAIVDADSQRRMTGNQLLK